jgi:hypothetical protein
MERLFKIRDNEIIPVFETSGEEILVKANDLKSMMTWTPDEVRKFGNYVYRIFDDFTLINIGMEVSAGAFVTAMPDISQTIKIDIPTINSPMISSHFGR